MDPQEIDVHGLDVHDLDVHGFLKSLPFTPDPFQLTAIEAVERGRSVVVTAPTGSGKTLIAEAAVHRSLTRGRRAFYTTPLKALSNQKFRDFISIYGADHVGLLTGDNSVNSRASVVVMTTEVLRNMIYSGSDLSSVETVILDEVHYLQDRFRGAVWEEVIIHSPPNIKLVCLSATVANADEFTRWIRSRRGPTELVIEKHRPVPLKRWWAVWDRFEKKAHVLPLFIGGADRTKPNPAIPRALARRGGRRRRFATPRQLTVIKHLAELERLPAIYFVFSRVGCDQAAARIARADIKLTVQEEREEIRSRVEEGTAHLDDSDLRAIGYATWLDRLERGVAAHHAGLVPAFKELTEQLFCDGLVKLVFATETLSLGINMPARTVVLDQLSKFTGQGHELMLPGEFTQLTGRAGRRGIDRVGHAVVLHSPYVPFHRVTSIADLGSHLLRSSFRPTYNMVVNLIANYPRRQAETLLEASFAQFQQRRIQQRHLRGSSRKAAKKETSVGGTGALPNLVIRFHRARRLLEHRGFLRGWSLRGPGEALRLVYSELDFLFVEAARAGYFSGLDSAELASLVSVFAYEPRRNEGETGALPTEALQTNWEMILELWRRHTVTEERYRLPPGRQPHPGFGFLAYTWSCYMDLDDVLDDASLSPGDFVRITRQVIDLLRQLEAVADSLHISGLGSIARGSRSAMDRGVVAAGGVQ